MARYLIERVWDPMEEEQLSAKGPLSKRILEDERFITVEWEHSHTVMDEDGNVKSYCVYSAPDPELIREHAKLLGDHSVIHVYEIGGDISPSDFD